MMKLAVMLFKALIIVLVIQGSIYLLYKCAMGFLPVGLDIAIIQGVALGAGVGYFIKKKSSDGWAE